MGFYSAMRTTSCADGESISKILLNPVTLTSLDTQEVHWGRNIP